MKKIIGISVGAGLAAAAVVALLYKRKDGSRLADGLVDSAKGLGNKLADYGQQIKARLLHHVKGPNGENVFIDMYDRQFYEDTEGKRIYLDE